MDEFYGADIAHANETGEITKPMMRILRKIATGETISVVVLVETHSPLKINPF